MDRNRTRRWTRLAALPGALLLALALLIALAVALLAAYLLLARLPSVEKLATSPSTPSILIVDRNGQPLYEAISPRGNKHVPLTLDQTPRACRDATLATEDANFYHHPGVDPVAIVRAAWLNWRAGTTVSGGSTLTQQLARNLLLTQEQRQERSLKRKLREAWLAWRLERSFSKDELLALYLNTTYYGHFATGIEAASEAYFGVHAGELDLAQCSLLAGLPQSPAAYNPIENPDRARARQATVLRLMVEHGYLTQEQAEDASREALAYAATPFPIEAPHFVMWTLSQLESLLPAERIAAGGLRVTTTLDLNWQKSAEAAVRRRLALLRPCSAVADATPGVNCDASADPARRVDNAALISLDPASGAVRAMVGSPDYFDAATSGALNATLSLRQPGSSIKPLTYAAALDPQSAAASGRAVWTAATIIPDIRSSFTTAEGKPYVPNNYDRVYHGPVTVRQALANSYNIPAVRALDYEGVDTLIRLAGRLGIPWERQGRRWDAGTEGQGDTAVDGMPRYGLSLTLGGGEVRLIDLAAAYAAFANGGFRVTPYGIDRIETLDGETLYDHNRVGARSPRPVRGPEDPAPTAATEAVDPRVAYLVTDILSDDAARLPAFGEGNVLEIGRPAAAKTGTTTDWRDNWTMGYTPELIAGVWVGNADNTPMKDVSGISGAGPIWHDFMTAVLADAPVSTFTRPAGLVRVEVCADSGLLPGGAAGSSVQVGNAEAHTVVCPHRRPEWFIAGTEPTQADASHVEVPIDVRTGQPATAVTPQQYRAPQTVWLLPLEYGAWARENGMLAAGMLPLDAAQARAASAAARAAPRTGQGDEPEAAASRPLALLSPDPNRAYRIDPGIPRASQQVPVTALPRFAPDGAITLLVDGAPYGQMAGPDYTAWWPLAAGRHTFQAVARTGDGAEVRSAEVAVVVE
jgi:penicillin-binding protein 1C